MSPSNLDVNTLLNPAVLNLIFVGLMIGALSAVLGFFMKCLEVVRFLRPSPHKAEVTLSEAYASKAELLELKNKVDDNDKESDARARRLHARIDPLVENTSHIKGSMEAMVKSFDNFTQVITAMSKDNRK